MKSDIFSTEVKEGYCRICGKFDRLTREHVIPKNAGGGVGVKLYSPIDLLIDKDSSHYILKQDGLTARTLCADCNNLIGREYDEDFGVFYKTVNYAVFCEIKKKINNGEIRKETDLIGGSAGFIIKNIKPFNIAKRVLASFCSIEYEGITKRIPEIQRAILEPSYIPDIKDFSLYFTLKLGGDSFSAAIAAGRMDGKIEVYSVIESGYTGFYLKETKNNADFSDSLGETINITNWLTDYVHNKEYDMHFMVPLISNMGLSVNMPAE